MIQKETIQFLKELKQNNNKAWFDDNRKRYQEARNDFIAFIEKTIQHIASFDKDVINLTPKDCIFRINRDIRFSKDKSPYKTNFGASISKGGKKSPLPGYYIHVAPGDSFIAGGVYMPDAQSLYAIRQEIDYNLDDFKKIINKKSFKENFDGLETTWSLKTAPKGYSTDHPAIEWLKLKCFIVSKTISDKEIVNQDFHFKSTKILKAIHPFKQFLSQAIEQPE